MKSRWIALPLLLLTLGGCASLSEKECRDADWEQIGYRDGLAGAARTRASDHGEACGKIGIKVDRPLYFKGYDAGLLRYCTPENAIEVGLAGAAYYGTCPPDTDALFTDHYRVARAVYDQRQRVSSLDSQRRSLEYKLEKAESDDARRKLRAELSRLDYELRQERDRLYYDETRLHRLTAGY
ncbi:DUF2799 domain-containing protein [Niveibacterium sp. 24ML]|uniref:DUF2799 domain-containing protein n=1 Tax=Niveibacterium sp. 24ML TaxID=2985512 RepID=UPI00226DE45B|nr:DUF2799 domain-containing protein [Niveibacterium sp. 24ML]MCX9155062.1 DUF2799 domain-containing protein [Niveibacterium sp. 24ML]